MRESHEGHGAYEVVAAMPVELIVQPGKPLEATTIMDGQPLRATGLSKEVALANLHQLAGKKAPPQTEVCWSDPDILELRRIDDEPSTKLLPSDATRKSLHQSVFDHSRQQLDNEHQSRRQTSGEGWSQSGGSI